jgi:uncharacterized membrane protein
MRAGTKFINGVMLGAGAMYLLDPERGNRRRALLRDRLISARRSMGGAAGATARDVRNRTAGAVAELRSRLHQDQAGDDVLIARVRSALGREVSHPSAIAVNARDGQVTLTGSILEPELGGLLDRVSRVRGVCGVNNELRVFRDASHVPELQGGRPRGDMSELLEESWTPALRFTAGVAGALLALRGLRRGGVIGTASGVVGLGLLTRATTNLPARRLTGIGAGRRAVDIHKSIDVQVPIEQVWALWSAFENFPRFMTHLREVRNLGGGRSHWVAKGPLGAPVEWDAVITAWRPGEAIAWKSLGGSPVENAGIVRFQPGPQDGTRVDVRLSYNPPAGAIGHAVAALLGQDARHQMDDDLLRFKSLLETGRTTVEQGKVELAQLTEAPSQTGGAR